MNGYDQRISLSGLEDEERARGNRVNDDDHLSEGNRPGIGRFEEEG